MSFLEIFLNFQIEDFSSCLFVTDSKAVVRERCLYLNHLKFVETFRIRNAFRIRNVIFHIYSLCV